jgi:hypothetical protein
VADDKSAAQPGDENKIQGAPLYGANPPEDRTPNTPAHQVATQYAAQAEEGKGTQDPYPYDPTNELLDGDDSPSQSELAQRGVRISASGRSLVHEDDPTGIALIPPPNANLEIAKAREKHAVAADMADGYDPEHGIEARKGARAKAAESRKKAASESSSDKGEGARTQPPQGRNAGPKAKG